MEDKLKSILKNLKVNENLISTVMGTIVVLIMGVMVFNYFKSINKNGVVTEKSASDIAEEKKDLSNSYKVQKGDRLWSIAEKVYGSGYNYVDIVKENKIKNPNVIEVGTELKIPVVEKRVVTKMEKTTKTAEAKEVKKEAVKESRTYVTVKGDYLWRIAVKEYGDGYAWVKIYNANKAKIGKNPSALEKGVSLVLP